MLNLKSFCVGVMVAALAGQVSAHSNHGHMEPISQPQAATKANNVIQTLVTNRKLDASWSKAQAQETTSQDTPLGKLWVVRYQNPQEKDTAKHVLYIFLDEMGNIVTANHDGKL